jgi:hypothetical protein
MENEMQDDSDFYVTPQFEDKDFGVPISECYPLSPPKKEEREGKSGFVFMKKELRAAKKYLMSIFST